MAGNVGVIPVANCDGEDSKPETKKGPLQLSVTFPPDAKSPSWVIERTRRYLENPRSYLKNQLGEKTFTERSSLMHIPDEIDKDFYGTGKHKQAFEKHIANLLGKDHGLFFITGIQAQLIALKIHSERTGNKRVAWHMTSHLEDAEEQAWEYLYRLDRTLLGSSPTANPSVEEIKQVLALPEDHRPASILLEVPNRSLGCQTYTFEELEEISQACRKANVNLHLDGARLWDIEPYYQTTAGRTFSDICSLFDSAYVSFYKGLGGIGGAMLVSNSAEMISEAKKWQRRAGGNVFTLMYQIIDDERGFNENIGAFAGRREKMNEIANGVKSVTEHFRSKDGTPYVRFIPEVPTCCQVHVLFQGFTSDQLTKARDRVEQTSNLRVFEKLRMKISVDEKMRQERRGEEKKEDLFGEEDLEPTTHFMEWMIMSDTEKINTSVFVYGYVALCEELKKIEDGTV